nr:NosD domain-containing protein [Candidatus Sigynarchaeota archaeon]
MIHIRKNENQKLFFISLAIVLAIIVAGSGKDLTGITSSNDPLVDPGAIDQSDGPLLNYTMTVGAPYTWVDATSGVRCDAIAGRDDACQQFTLPFTFHFYNETFNYMYVCTNGYVSFEYATSYNNMNFPVSSPRYMIAPYWDDLHSTSPCNIFVRNMTGPNRVVIEFQDYYTLSNNYIGTFEIILYESQMIIFNYDSVNYVGDCTTGLNFGQDTRYFTQYSGLTPITDDLSIQFIAIINNFPPSLVNGTVSPASGPQSTLFTYIVDYVDADNNTPIYVNAVIDGWTYDMVKQNMSDINYVDGCRFQFLTHLQPGAHTYYFECMDTIYTASTSVTSNPAVSAESASNASLTSLGVNPPMGHINGMYTYAVIYSDPYNIEPSLNIVVNSVTFILNKVDPADNDYVDGCIYAINLMLTAGGTYEYTFNAFNAFMVTSLGPIPGPVVGPMILHAPIAINSNSQLDAFCAGNGTDGISWATAHVLENFIINADGNRSAISIQNTNRFLIIRNCILSGAGSMYWGDAGISIMYSSNIRIINCTIESNGRDGIFIYDSSNDEVLDTVLASNFENIYAEYSTQLRIHNNTINSGSYGIYFSWSVQDVVVTNNTISGCNNEGIRIYGDCDNITIAMNILFSNWVGMRLENQVSNICTLKNAFIMNSWYQVVNDATMGSNNTWDDGVNGNYYSDYTSQNPAALNNGIVWETDYAINGSAGGYDTRPLVSPFVFQPDNFAPSFISPSCSPVSGTQATVFTFRITYVDADNNRPRYVNLVLDGIAYPMGKSNTSDTNYADGNIYITSIYVQPGSHIYSFSCFDGRFYGSSSNMSGPTVTSSNTVAPNLTDIGFFPMMGHRFQRYDFMVNYTDADNNAPTLIDITVNGTSYPMTKLIPTDTNYMDGCLFGISIQLNVTGTYEYSLFAFDGLYTAFTNTTVGPTVDIIMMHAPIRITSNAQLDAFCAGNGTDGLSWGTAHVIRDLAIDANGDTAGIYLSTTTRYLIIENCIFSNSGTNWDEAGITALDCQNIRITNSTAASNNYGIYITNGINHVIDNTLLTVNNNNRLERSRNCTIVFNLMQLGWSGLELYDCWNNTIAYNTFSNNSNYGLYISGNSYENTIQGNTMEYNDYGIYLNNQVWRNHIYHNAFMNNVWEQAYSVSNTADNEWDDGLNGNYYSDYSTRYPAAVNNGYVWETPYVIPGDFIEDDACALVFPYMLQPNDFAPIISAISCTPVTGNQLTIFTFNTTYSDADNNRPSRVDLIIDGYPYPMAKQDPLDTNYMDGCYYVYSTYLQPAIHQYFVNATDGRYFGISGTFSLTVTAGPNLNMPVLSAASVNPASGYQNITLFSFTVNYADADNNAPQSIMVIINGTILPMSKVNPTEQNYIGGVLYQVSTTLTTFGIFTFDVNASDGMYLINLAGTPGPTVERLLPYSTIPLVGVRIGVVLYHNENNPMTTYPQVYQDLLARGASVSGIYTALSAPVLANYELLWFDDNGFPMQPSELAALQLWIMAGGRLLLTGDNGGTSSDILNWFAINPIYITIPSGWTSTITLHPITAGVSLLHFPTSNRYLDTSGSPMAFDCVEMDGRTLVSLFDVGFTRIVMISSNIFQEPTYGDNRLFFNNTMGWLCALTNNFAPGLVGESLVPLSGDQATLFACSVTYFDQDNNVPVHVSLSLNGTLYPLSKLDPFDNNYVDGCLYNLSLYIQPGDYEYSFTCSDYLYSNSTAVYTGLSVTETNIFSPNLSEGMVVPGTGIANISMFNFVVNYTDADNNAPGIVEVIINGTIFFMAQLDPADTNYMDGCWFVRSMYLDVGTYNFQFNCWDGLYSDSLGPFTGPEVVVSPYADHMAADYQFFIMGMNTTLNSTMDRISGLDYHASFNIPIMGNFSHDVSLDTRLITNASGLWPSGTRTNAWIPISVSIGDLVPICVDGEGDHVFNVTGQTMINLPGIGVVRAWILNDLTTAGASAIYESSTGMLISGTFRYAGGSQYYTMDLVATNVIFRLVRTYLLDGKVLPVIGSDTIIYNFTVTYVDLDNNAPTSVDLVLNSTSYAMVQVDPFDTNYVDGALYAYVTTLISGNYSFSFTALTGSTTSLFPTSGGTINGPVVLPYEFCMLRDGMVSPNASNEYAIYIFSVIYQDTQDAAPVYVHLVLDGAVYNMIKDPTDNDFTNGVLYRLQNSSMTIGTHSYYYDARNATGTLRFPLVGSLSGPRVVQMYFPSFATGITPVIDGTFNATEWASATAYRATVNMWDISSPGYTGVVRVLNITIWILNDEQFVYMCVQIAGETYTASMSSDMLYIFFDGDMNGTLDTNENVIGISTNPTMSFYTQHDGYIIGPMFMMNLDINNNGTEDGDGAFTHSNPIEGMTGTYTFEISLPFNSADFHDLQLPLGASTRFKIAFMDQGAMGYAILPCISELMELLDPTSYGVLELDNIPFANFTANTTSVITMAPVGFTFTGRVGDAPASLTTACIGGVVGTD